MPENPFSKTFKHLSTLLCLTMSVFLLTQNGADAQLAGPQGSAGSGELLAGASSEPALAQAPKIAYRSRRKRRRHYRRRRVYRKPKIGILVQTADGRIVCSERCDESFNPASAIKLLTAYGALKKFGANHRFVTSLYTTGELDADSGLQTGDIYIDGRDPDFDRSDAAALLKKLEDRGIKKVNGRLVVSPGFTFRHNGNATTSGRSLVSVWKFADKNHRITMSGPVVTGLPDSKAELVFKHQSEPLKQTLKVMLSKSLNGCAERIGSTVGGLPQLEKLASKGAGLTPGSIRLSSSSGLGINRMTPKQMMKVLIALGDELCRQGLNFQDIMPVSGVDRGTMEKRFDSKEERGSVIAKTGTLTRTDGGASALVGIMRSRQEDLYFVLFGGRGSISAMRSKHDATIRNLQKERGGPCAFEYPACRARVEEKDDREPTARQRAFKELVTLMLVPACRANEPIEETPGDIEAGQGG